MELIHQMKEQQLATGECHCQEMFVRKHQFEELEQTLAESRQPVISRKGNFTDLKIPVI